MYIYIYIYIKIYVYPPAPACRERQAVRLLATQPPLDIPLVTEQKAALLSPTPPPRFFRGRHPPASPEATPKYT